MARVEVITGAERRRRRSEEQKRAIVAESLARGAIVSEVARRADVGPGQIYRWRQEFRTVADGFAQVLIARRRRCRRRKRRPIAQLAARRQSRSSLPVRSGYRDRSRRVWPRPWSRRYRGDDPGFTSGVRIWLAGGHTDMRRGMNSLAIQVQKGLRRDPHAGDLYVFRGKRGHLIKIFWHDGIGISLSLYAKRLECGRFIWPSPADGMVAISAAQLAYMLDGIDWRNPVRTWQPGAAG